MQNVSAKSTDTLISDVAPVSNNAQHTFTFLDALFVAWVLSLPFLKFQVIGPLSLDNALAPLLLVAWLILLPRQKISAKRRRTLITVCLVIFLYVLFSAGNPISSGHLGVAATEIYTQSRFALYLLLPVLFVDNLHRFRRLLQLLTLNTILICLSAIAVAVGIIKIEFATVESRLDGIGRSGGLTAHVGPLAALITLAILALQSSRSWPRPWLLKQQWFRWTTYLALVAGAVAAQSRNVLLTATLVVFFYFGFSTLIKRSAARIVASVVLSLPFLITLAYFLPLLAEELYIAVIGTGHVKGSAMDRLESYNLALELLRGEWLLGLDAHTRELNDSLLRSLHDIWLGVLLKGGIVGLIPIIALFYLGIIGPLSLARQNRTIRQDAVAMSAYTLGLMFSASFYVAHNSHLFWVCLALPMCIQALNPEPVHSHIPSAKRPAPPSAVLRYRTSPTNRTINHRTTKTPDAQDLTSSTGPDGGSSSHHGGGRGP